MDKSRSRESSNVGFIASIVAAALVFVFAVLLVVAIRVPEANLYSFLVCFLLAPVFVIMTACVHSTAPEDKKVWSRIGLSFSVIYAAFCTLTYYIQWVFVRPNQLILPIELIRLLSFSPGTLMFAVDMLGYSFLCLSTLFTAGVFTGRENRWIRIFYIGHGVLFLPTLVFPGIGIAQDMGVANPANTFGSFALLFWCFIFTPLAVMTAGYFRNQMIKKYKMENYDRDPL